MKNSVLYFAVGFFYISILFAAENDVVLHDNISTSENVTTGIYISATGIISPHFSEDSEVAINRLAESIQYVQATSGDIIPAPELSEAATRTIQKLNQTMLTVFDYKSVKPMTVLQELSDILLAPPPDPNRLLWETREAVATTTQYPILQDIGLQSEPISLLVHRVIAIEYLEQVAKLLNIDVGMTEAGLLTFGKQGCWTSQNPPQYLIIFTDISEHNPTPEE